MTEESTIKFIEKTVGQATASKFKVIDGQRLKSSGAEMIFSFDGIEPFL